MEWIKCSERMPEQTGDIIVVSDGIVMSGVSFSRKKGFYLQAWNMTQMSQLTMLLIGCLYLNHQANSN